MSFIRVHLRPSVVKRFFYKCLNLADFPASCRPRWRMTFEFHPRLTCLARVFSLPA